MTAATRLRLLTPVLFLVTCLVAVISSLGAPLVPLVSREMGVSLSDAQWSLTATLLMGAVSAPIMGRLGDGRWRRQAIAGGVMVVLAGCALAAVASSLPLLVVGRTMQGVGLGLVPLAMAAARDALPAPRVGPAIALLSVAAAAGVGAGYPISGFIAEHMGLSAAYWFGAIFSALALAALLPVVPRHPSVLTATVCALVLGAAMTAFVQVPVGAGFGFGSTVLTAGLCLVPSSITTSLPAGRCRGRRGC